MRETMNKFLTVVSYPQNEDEEFIATKKDYEIISVENVVRICCLYDSNGYTLIIDFENDQYEYPLSDSISDRELQAIITHMTNFLEDTQTTAWLDLTNYQR